ncbi:peptidoglycan DD-metalloendopeptidase family protein [Desulfoscipio geothermicus]|uniref:peptidoglycan DD-metalloendopeptidase family protein n=1 Tax=Desulfoscipio geothermicus TaxID=39060 RepID=UPI001A97BFB9|nr:M23 family metallopeptidase [Desulfoscipio geothermicus]
MAALLVAGWLAMPLRPAQARLDELIRTDAPYQLPPEMSLKEKSVPVAAATPRVYIVRDGDTLSEIAVRHRVDVQTLAEMNHLHDHDRIVKGQALMLPGTAIPYTVRRGETLSVIACRFGVSERELTETNNIDDPDRLLAGQRLMVPAGQGGGETPISRALPLKQLGWPVVGWISSVYGMRDGAMHEGIDIAADYGQKVRAVKDGRVVFAGPRGTYGITVIIDHGGGLRTLYAHNSRVLVCEGQRVRAGQPIARVGSTGRSTGPHLHLEVLLNGIPVDPMLCLNRTYA